MKVLLVGDYPPPPGGIGIHVQQLHSFISSHGIQSSVLDIGQGGGAAPDVLPARTASQFARALARFTAEGWLIHLHTSGNNPKSWYVAAAAGLTSRASNAGRVLTVHSGLSIQFIEQSATHRALVRFATHGYSRIVAVSERVAAAIGRCGVPARKLTVEPAFCASELQVSSAPPILLHALARRAPLLAMAHHPSPVYGTRLMFQALKQLVPRHPTIGLALMGVETDSPELMRDAQRAGVADRIDLLGALEHGQSLAVIQASAVFVRPTFADGDALSVREALALGVPCVASDASDRPAGAIVFRTGDADDLASRVEKALEAGVRVRWSVDSGPALLALYRELGLPRSRLRWSSLLKEEPHS